MSQTASRSAKRARIVRKAVARVPEGESIRHLNIMPMMDMMTILLVAFIFQMATSALEVTAGTVDLPRTETDAPLPEKAWTLVITPNGIVVEGEPIVSVANGDVDPAEKEGGCLGVEDPAPDRTSSRSCTQEEVKQRQKAGGDPATSAACRAADHRRPHDAVPPPARGDVLGEAEGSRLQAFPTDRPEELPDRSRPK